MTTSPYPRARPRRLRRTAALRRAVSETRLDPGDLVAPLFVKEGLTDPDPVPSLPGVYQHTLQSLRKSVSALRGLGVTTFLLFGIPQDKDAVGSGAWAPDGIMQKALTALRDDHGDEVVLTADTCLDEYTDHGHCGPVDASGHVDNDAAIEAYGWAAVSQARAGAHVVAPSGMMDGQVARIRGALDDAGFAEHAAIMSYATKYASALYGPFRDAAECEPSFGDRASYQLDPANAAEGVREAETDAAEGADMLLVKPGIAYLDVLRAVKRATGLPTAAYQVSGEYAMLAAAGERGWIEQDRIAVELALSMRRAGADLVISYGADSLARALHEG